MKVSPIFKISRIERTAPSSSSWVTRVALPLPALGPDLAASPIAASGRRRLGNALIGGWQQQVLRALVPPAQPCPDADLASLHQVCATAAVLPSFPAMGILILSCWAP